MDINRQEEVLSEPELSFKVKIQGMSELWEEVGIRRSSLLTVGEKSKSVHGRWQGGGRERMMSAQNSEHGVWGRRMHRALGKHGYFLDP